MLRLKQICLVAADLDPVEEDLKGILGLEVAYRDPRIDYFGLRNVLLPVGNSLLEVVAPIRDGTAAGRQLERRGGDGGYMVILQCGDAAAARERVESLGVRIVFEDTDEETIGIQLHPKDLPGALVELRWQRGGEDPAGAWDPAGPEWQLARRTDVVRAITAAEIQGDDPEALAARWGEVLDRPVVRTALGAPEIELDDGSIRFVTASDGRGTGLGGIDVEAVDRERLLAAADARECRVSDDTFMICGTRMKLV
jgi:catechol 2,3-dioxygenase-like lactoylglutathione lyase family enzyme